MHRVPTNLIRTGILLICTGLLYFSCSREEKSAPPADRAYLLVLGTSQDGGFPQAGCTKECCRNAWENPKIRRLVACIAIVDPLDGKQWIIDATPDFREQFFKLGQISENYGRQSITGIILTHAHIGHYTGLIHLGREVMGTENIPVYAMPRMKQFLMESFKQFEELSPADRSKVHFIHFNHTNPVVIEGSEPFKEVYNKGFHIAKEGQVIIL